jgi:alanyl-tRNA synthetase
LNSTGEIGFIKIVYTERVQDGVERLAYAVGLQALKAVQENERLLWKVSETLNAPLEKLDKTAEKLVKELKEANAERRKLIKQLARQLAVKESIPIQESVQIKQPWPPIKVGDITIWRQDFVGAIDVDLMVQTASEIIARDSGSVALLSGSNNASARILAMAGKVALEKGFNAVEVIRLAAPIIGGGGGGKPNFAQGGGTQPEKLQEAIKKAEETIKKQLRH